jgi:uncharacterized protein YbjT (DUF2867 family)
LIGGSGFLGSALIARLRKDGHHVTASVRSSGDRPLAANDVLACDLGSLSEADWRFLLTSVEVVINTAGVLQDSSRDSTSAAHAEGPKRLWAACEKAGVRTVIHFSAMGVDRETPSEFSRSKLVGDEALIASALDWVILRPSVVVAPNAAYGGSALFRGLAALPWLPIMPETGRLQIVQRADVVETVARLLKEEVPRRVVLELSGPEEIEFPDVVRAFREWFGWKPQRTVAVPEWAAKLGYRLGDVAGSLGWRPPIRSTAQAEIVRGAVGDNRRWRELTGIEPQSFGEALLSEPPSVEERWFARLYLLKPLVFAVLVLFWIGTGLVSLGPGWEVGMSYMRAGGAEGIGPPAIVAGALADITIGIGIAFRKTSRVALYAAIAISLAYALIGTILLPSLWRDPLGPMLKIWPIIVLLFVALAIRDDR